MGTAQRTCAHGRQIPEARGTSPAWHVGVEDRLCFLCGFFLVDVGTMDIFVKNVTNLLPKIAVCSLNVGGCNRVVLITVTSHMRALCLLPQSSLALSRAARCDRDLSLAPHRGPGVATWSPHVN